MISPVMVSASSFYQWADIVDWVTFGQTVCKKNPQLIDWVEVLRPTRHKVGHFVDVLPSQSLGLVLKKKRKQTQQK